MTEEVFYLIGPLKLILILLVIFRDYFPEYKTELFTFLGTYLFFICGAKNDSEDIVIFDKTWIEITPFLISLACIITITALILSIFSKRRKKNLIESRRALEELENKFSIIRQEYYRLCSDNIRFLFQDFFENSGGNGRVSLFKHRDNQFVLLGRYSKNPAYNKKGREDYADTEGFLSMGWQEGELNIFGVPSWAGNGKEHKSFIRKYCEISDATLRQLKMKSCSFYIKRIESEDARNPLGIVVFEQLQNTEINNKPLNEILDFYKFPIETYLKSMQTIF